MCMYVIKHNMCYAAYIKLLHASFIKPNREGNIKYLFDNHVIMTWRITWEIILIIWILFWVAKSDNPHDYKVEGMHV